jgi:hypothetical protein
MMYSAEMLPDPLRSSMLRAPGGVHGQQVPAAPGGDPRRPADQQLALRTAAERGHHPLPGGTAGGIVAAGAVPLWVAGKLGGQPQ